jgi:hypothetical protein
MAGAWRMRLEGTPSRANPSPGELGQIIILSLGQAPEGWMASAAGARLSMEPLRKPMRTL